MNCIIEIKSCFMLTPSLYYVKKKKKLNMNFSDKNSAMHTYYFHPLPLLKFIIYIYFNDSFKNNSAFSLSLSNL